jgi:hypothetical protein
MILNFAFLQHLKTIQISPSPINLSELLENDLVTFIAKIVTLAFDLF